MLKFVSWNVNGLRACAGKGFAESFKALDADFFCLQETKLQEGQIDLAFKGYSSYWNYARKKGYSGTAVYTRCEPLSASYGIGIPCHDTEGRVITLEMPDFYLVNVYVPNSQDGLRRLDYRMSWEDDFRAYVSALAASKGVIICGDMNVAHEEIDLRNPDKSKPVEYCGDLNVAHNEIDLKNYKTNVGNAGFSDQERGKMTALLQAGFVDSWRMQHPGEAKYSWWSYRMRARERNVGWRIDYFLVSENLRSSILSTGIHNDISGSDHCPVELIIKV